MLRQQLDVVCSCVVTILSKNLPQINLSLTHSKTLDLPIELLINNAERESKGKATGR